MRATVSNLRGVRSLSGMRIANSRSRPLTRSVRLKESSRPDSKRDSSGEGSIGLPATCRRSSTILVWWFMRNLVRCRPCVLVGFELPHQVAEEHGGETAIPDGREVDVVRLRKSGVHPVAHRSASAHALAPVPI